MCTQGCTRFPVTGPCESEFCPRNCTGHGKCEDVNMEASCACEAGFTGHFCATQLCPADCSGHGRCHALDGTCDCDDGFGGLDCAQVQCANNCTQPNGVCDVKTGICTCQTGYSLGVDCHCTYEFCEHAQARVSSQPTQPRTHTHSLTHAHTHTYTHTHATPHARTYTWTHPDGLFAGTRAWTARTNRRNCTMSHGASCLRCL